MSPVSYSINRALSSKALAPLTCTLGLRICTKQLPFWAGLGKRCPYHSQKAGKETKLVPLSLSKVVTLSRTNAGGFLGSFWPGSPPHTSGPPGLGRSLHTCAGDRVRLAIHTLDPATPSHLCVTVAPPSQRWHFPLPAKRKRAPGKREPRKPLGTSPPPTEATVDPAPLPPGPSPPAHPED